jgi:hypothetical protein
MTSTCGRPRLYCSRRCKKAAGRRRRVSAPVSALRAAVSKRTEPVPTLMSAQPSPDHVEAVRLARAKVERCRRKLDEARAACATFGVEEPDPLEGREFRTYTGTEWLVASGGGFGEPGDYEAMAEAIRERFERDS